MLSEMFKLPLMGQFLLVIFIFIYLLKRWTTRRRILHLGGYAPRIPFCLPLGVDILFRAMRNARNHKALETWRCWLSSAPNHGTMEANVLLERYIITADPENIKAVLATQFEDFGKGQGFHDTWKKLLGDSIFSTDGAQWRGSRHLIRPLFVKDRVSDLHVLEQHVQQLLKTIAADGPHDGRKVDISDLIFRYTLDVATDFLLGESVGSLRSPEQAFETAFNHAQHFQMMVSRAGNAHVLIPRASLNRSIQSIDAFLQPYIEKALNLQDSAQTVEKSHPDYTFLHALAQYTSDPKLIRDQLVSILIAGRDTTASALSWAFFELAKHPRVVIKLRKEISDAVGSNQPTYSQLKDMKYLQNVIRETLRLYPAIPINVRTALRDTQLPRGGGSDGASPIGLLKGTRVFYSALYMQRRESLYPEGSKHDEFRPERWETWQPASWTYIPFNGGPRICLGQQFALTEIAYTIVRLLQHFERIEAGMDNMEPVMETKVSVKPAGGVCVRLWNTRPGSEVEVDSAAC